MAKNLLEDVVKTSKKRGYLAISITGMEKWNHPKWGEDNKQIDTDGPKEDGSYDVEGHAWTDVNFQVGLDLLDKKDRKHWILDFKSWLEDVNGIWKDTVNIKKRWFNLDLFFSFVFRTISTLGLTKTYWGSTVQSFAVAKSDLARDIAHDQLDSARPDRDMDKWLKNINDRDPEYDAWLHKLIDLEKKIYSELKDDQVKEHVLKICDPISSPGLYVLREDPSIIYVDTAEVPYDMKDGFSNKKIAQILEDWAHSYLDLQVPVIDIDAKGAKSRTWRTVMASMVHFNAEKRDGKYGN
jgi:hypothetical protein